MGWIKKSMVLGIVCQGLVPLGYSVAQAQPDLVQVGRYTTQAAQPAAAAAQPLQVFAHITFPRSTVQTVGGALEHTLVRTGYRLLPENMQPGAASFLLLPLPESQRQLGSYRVEDILKVLIGPMWVLQIDHRTRQVWFSDVALATPDKSMVDAAERAQVEQQEKLKTQADSKQKTVDATRAALYR